MCTIKMKYFIAILLALAAGVASAQLPMVAAQFGGAVGGSDPYWADVVLLLVNDNKADTTTSFADQSLLANTLTAAAPAQYSTARAPTGMTSCAHMTSTTSVVTMTPNTATVFGTGDFTVEFYYYPQTVHPTQTIGTSWSMVGWQLYGVIAPQWRFYDNGSQIFQGSTTIGPAWHHVAVVRASGNVSGYIDGVLDAGPTSDATNFNDNHFTIGASGGASADWNICSLRLTKGIARYTSGFAPPTLPLPNH